MPNEHHDEKGRFAPARSAVAKKMRGETIPGTRAVGQRLANAEDNFLQSLMERGGISMADAVKVFNVYHKQKVLKRDVVGGRYSVKHGGFMDKEVIHRALAMSKSD